MKFKSKKELKKERGWIIKNIRPEEYLENPKLYYTDEEVEKYSKSGGMKRAQEKIAYRILELLDLKEGSSILDLGSGPGYTANVYRYENYKVTCLDIIPKMVELAKENGFKTYLGDMKNIKEIFKNKKFDAIVSVSALQWIKNKDDITKISEGIYHLLKDNGKLAIQFYPKSEKELNEIYEIFKKTGFSGDKIIDWPNIPKNRTIFLSMKK